MVIENSSNARVHGVGRVIFKFRSKYSITLQNVYHVPKIIKKLISWSVLNLQGFKLVSESSKVISKNNMFVGKGYICDGLFKLNIKKCVWYQTLVILVTVYYVSTCDVSMGDLAMWTITLLIITFDLV